MSAAALVWRVYAPVVAEGRALGVPDSKIRGTLAGLLAIEANLPRRQAHAVAVLVTTTSLEEECTPFAFFEQEWL